MPHVLTFSYGRVTAFAPGEPFHFDWSENWAVLGGKRVKLQVARTHML